MFNDITFLAVIPARGGSKRLPRKNILTLSGKPLIAWSIEAALQCKYIDEVIVTSDDDEILDIANQFGSKTIKRPSELASDKATSFEAIKHTINNVGEYDYIVLLQPTSPLKTAQHLNEAIEQLMSNNADALISVTPMDHNPLWSNTLPANGSMMGFLHNDILNRRSQDLPTYYRVNGAIYICKKEKLLKEESFFIKDNIFSYIMDREVSVDIDEALDFEYAQLLMEHNNE